MSENKFVVAATAAVEERFGDSSEKEKKILIASMAKHLEFMYIANAESMDNLFRLQHEFLKVDRS